MQRYNINNRLAYLSGGVQSAGGMWPSVAAGDWWDVAGETCLIAYQPKGAASYAASLVNLANSGTYDATEGTAPAWDATNGWQFDRTSSEYLDTGFSALASGTYTMIARFAGRDTDINATQILAGYYTSTTSRLSLEIESPSTNRFWWQYGNASTSYSPNTDASGVLAATISNLYLNGSSVGTLTGSLASDANRSITIGARNNQFNGVEFFATVNILAFALYSTTLDSTQISDLTDAMNAL